MKYDWKKSEKEFYMPKTTPELRDIPPIIFFTLSGVGNPNEPDFANNIVALYSLSYAVKMSPKKNLAPTNFYDFAVYPLEGVWTLADKNREYSAANKNNFAYKIMIRQPDFVDKDFFLRMREMTMRKKPDLPISRIKFEQIADGKSVQILHVGSYDDESKSFAKMAEFLVANNLSRKDLTHREIYLSDARKTTPEELKTVLRWSVK